MATLMPVGSRLSVDGAVVSGEGGRRYPSHQKQCDDRTPARRGTLEHGHTCVDCQEWCQESYRHE